MSDRRPLGERMANGVAAFSCNFNAFIFACVTVLIWAALGPHYDYSDTWQLVINTGTTIATFLMAFLIGANQQRADTTRALMLELIERHAGLIEEHTDAWEKHASETHSLAQATHALVREVHGLAADLKSSNQRIMTHFGLIEAELRE